ncbi:nuclear transport factor 2 family protein [Sphingomonas sp. CGMCC 1.13654]|uniref:Nuclear transport factor 2 family protein n=1 Tax=Sphingomonas chungangi TaxID=2683589 RepID=A0A838L5R7_9SPHN|nr:nuclear transport factor 2 family protein [Sphingomonas chungangi]MBA2933952.1 nuclear transport factor 2 family protein [Sphingomonas chungangi]MVW57079.1 nuclear transport factor 2 family protein [Sphingomonas chungangi]
MSPTNSLPDWLDHALEALQAGDIKAYTAIYAEDAVHEFPVAAAGGPRRLEGRDQIAAYMSRLPEMIRFGSIDDIRVREAGDELIVEASGHHHRLSDDTSLDIAYIWFITHRGGMITHFRDYMAPPPASE